MPIKTKLTIEESRRDPSRYEVRATCCAKHKPRVIGPNPITMRAAECVKKIIESLGINYDLHNESHRLSANAEIVSEDAGRIRGWLMNES